MKEVLYRSDSVDVRKSPIDGMGVFAKKDIARGEMIEECHIVLVNLKGRPGFYENICDENIAGYLYSYEDIPFKDSNLPGATAEVLALPLGFGALYNHHDKFNVEYTIDREDKIFVYSAARDISKDEELFITYDIENEKV